MSTCKCFIRRGKLIPWASLGLLLMLPMFSQAVEQRKPNILFILADNLGYGELGAYGGGITRGAATPSIDSIAADGVRFTNMNMEPQCTPSRSSIMTGRFAIRSGTYAVPFGGARGGLTPWEVTMGESLSNAGYATAYFGKWHLGSEDGRLPNDQGFDQWYGIPRTTDEAMWLTSSGYSRDVMPPEQILEGRKGEKSRALKVYDLDQRRLMDAELTRRTIEMMQTHAGKEKPFFVVTALTQPHLPTLPNPKFSGKTGNGDWADMLAEMDSNVGQLLETIDKLGIREDTLVIFASDNGAEYIKPWDGWAGPWRGSYFTAWEGGLRVPFLIRWPGKIPSGKVTDAIVHGVDLFPSLAKLADAKVPDDRPIDGVDQSQLFLGKTDKSAREGFPIWVADRLQAVKWRNFKVHFYQQDNMFSTAEKLGLPHIYNLYTNPREDDEKLSIDSWVLGPVLKMVRDFNVSVAKYPLIPMGAEGPTPQGG